MVKELKVETVSRRVISLDQSEIPNYWSGQCFGCSPTNSRGLQLRFWQSEKGCFTRCTIADELCG